MSWATARGLIRGNGSDLNPKGIATRAEASSIIMGFIESIVK